MELVGGSLTLIHMENFDILQRICTTLYKILNNEYKSFQFNYLVKQEKYVFLKCIENY